MAFTFFMRDQPTLEHAAEHMIRYASGRSRIKVWDADEQILGNRPKQFLRHFQRQGL